MKLKPGWIFLFIVGIGGAAGAFYRAWVPDVAWLRIQEVAVTAEPPLTEAEVRKVLPKLEGKNLLTLSGDAVMKKLLDCPWVETATIKKEFPNRLVLTVQSKKPVATRQDVNRLVFLDDNGAEIDRWTSVKAAGFDLPVIAFDRAELVRQWSPRTLVQILLSMQKAIDPKYRISQFVAVDPPYFKVFLTSPTLELLFSQHTWETQLPFFVDVLSRPPRQIGQAHKINLVFPKKAVVSFP